MVVTCTPAPAPRRAYNPLTAKEIYDALLARLRKPMAPVAPITLAKAV